MSRYQTWYPDTLPTVSGVISLTTEPESLRTSTINRVTDTCKYRYYVLVIKIDNNEIIVCNHSSLANYHDSFSDHFFFKNLWRTSVLFVEPLTPLFCTIGFYIDIFLFHSRRLREYPGVNVNVAYATKDLWTNVLQLRTMTWTAAIVVVLVVVALASHLQQKSNWWMRKRLICPSCRLETKYKQAWSTKNSQF